MPRLRKRPKFPMRFFPTLASGRIAESWAELMRQAQAAGTGWCEDADGEHWAINATYSADRVHR